MEKEKNITTENSKAINEAEILELMNNRVKAVNAKDIDRLMLNYAPDVLSFDAINQLHLTGSNAIRKRAEEWFSLYQGDIGCELRDLHIRTGDNVAFCHCLNRISGTTTDGNQVNMWVRTTVCFSKIDGKWMIMHEHTSVPFDVKSGKAMLNAMP